ncbi:MAG: SAM-dependent chlorinase/fluorinase [Bryobacteraceae bacterium]
MAIITLTTDFGESDHFVASMKGVILSIAPRATVVDVTHNVTAFDVAEGAFTIAEACRTFPPKTIHVGVVDPGVGTERRPLLVESGGQYFIGPDNGLFGMIYSRPGSKVRHLTASKYFRPTPSATFHGRDIFAPAAAHLAKGARPSSMGRAVDDYLRPSGIGPIRTDKRCWAGSVVKADRFGNLITNLHIDEFPTVRERPIVLLAGVHAIEKLVTTFAEATAGEAVVIIGSSGYLEIAANQASAAKKLGIAAGTPVELSIY